MIMPFEIHLLISRWWFLKFCSFTPGKMMQFDYVAFFRMGWFSRQPDMFFSIGIVNEIPFWSLKVGLDSSHSEGKQCMKTWYKKFVFTKGNDVMDNNRISIRQFSPIFGSTIDHPQGPADTYKLWRGHERYKDVLFRCDENLMTIWWNNAFIIDLDFGTIFWHSRDLVLGSKSMSWVLSGKLRSKQYSKPGLVVFIKNFTTLLYRD